MLSAVHRKNPFLYRVLFQPVRCICCFLLDYEGLGILQKLQS
nr:MAG TPA: hypothetical protein [Caudoviricetes sp.]